MKKITFVLFFAAIAAFNTAWGMNNPSNEPLLTGAALETQVAAIFDALTNVKDGLTDADLSSDEITNAVTALAVINETPDMVVKKLLAVFQADEERFEQKKSLRDHLIALYKGAIRGQQPEILRAIVMRNATSQRAFTDDTNKDQRPTIEARLQQAGLNEHDLARNEVRAVVDALNKLGGDPVKRVAPLLALFADQNKKNSLKTRLIDHLISFHAEVIKPEGGDARLRDILSGVSHALGEDIDQLKKAFAEEDEFELYGEETKSAVLEKIRADNGISTKAVPKSKAAPKPTPKKAPKKPLTAPGNPVKAPHNTDKKNQEPAVRALVNTITPPPEVIGGRPYKLIAGVVILTTALAAIATRAAYYFYHTRKNKAKKAARPAH